MDVRRLNIREEFTILFKVNEREAERLQEITIIKKKTFLQILNCVIHLMGQIVKNQATKLKMSEMMEHRCSKSPFERHGRRG